MAVQPRTTASRCSSRPMEGRAMFMAEDMKGARKAAMTDTARTVVRWGSAFPFSFMRMQSSVFDGPAEFNPDGSE